MKKKVKNPMDYSIITEQIMNKRRDSLPSNLQDILNSGAMMRTVQQIARVHYLDENRTIMLMQLTAFILLGFISLDELSLEISENLHLNYDHATALAKELKVRIFRTIKDDLENVYSPIEEGEESYWNRDANIRMHANDTNDDEEIESEEIKERDITEKLDKADGPLILHEERPLTEKRKGDAPKGFSLPMGFFKKKNVSDGGEAVKVRVETRETDANIRMGTNDTNNTNAKFVQDGKRVVHYSELRTQLTPFEGGEDLINLQTLQPQINNPKLQIYPNAPNTEGNPKLQIYPNATNTEGNSNIQISPNTTNETDKTNTATQTPMPTQTEPRERTKGFWFFSENIPPKKVSDANIRIHTNDTNSKEEKMITENATTVSKVDIQGQAKVEGNIVDLR